MNGAINLDALMAVLDFYGRQIEKSEAQMEAEAARDMHGLAPMPSATEYQTKMALKQRKKVARWHKSRGMYLSGKRDALDDLRAAFSEPETTEAGG